MMVSFTYILHMLFKTILHMWFKTKSGPPIPLSRTSRMPCWSAPWSPEWVRSDTRSCFGAKNAIKGGIIWHSTLQHFCCQLCCSILKFLKQRKPWASSSRPKALTLGCHIQVSVQQPRESVRSCLSVCLSPFTSFYCWAAFPVWILTLWPRKHEQEHKENLEPLITINGSLWCGLSLVVPK